MTDMNRRSTDRERNDVRLAVVGLGISGLLATNPCALEAQERPAQQAEPDSITAISIDTVRVGGRIDDLIGIAATASQGRVGSADLHARPITREGELLETVPGLIVTQHSGEGKANQYFVRGFNLDHGTDFRTVVEGMPVNLPTHGHGQGYTDLNFIIPEFVDLLDYRLGVYHAEVGDFGSAGGAELHLARSLERPFAKATVGENGLARLVAGGSAQAAGGTLLAGGEARVYDGPWELPQEMRKFNGMARFTLDRTTHQLSILGLAYASRWNASDQIPLRAVQDGRIGRFGQIDPTDGGEARRFSLSANWRRLGGGSAQELQLFGIYSDLDLYSNFTYFLEAPSSGDQFQQEDGRFVLGAAAKHVQDVYGLGAYHGLTAGLQSRADLIGELGLHWSEAQQRRGTVRDDEVAQASTGAFVEAASRWRPWLRTVLGARGDVYYFDVRSDLAANSGETSAAILSPKASVVITPSTAVELYLSGGFGFHSNDARGTTIAVDPVTGEEAAPVDPLVRSRGAELGLRAAPIPGLRSTLTLWGLDLDSELLFVGDAGATEPSASSRRRGITWANFYRPLPGLSLDADVSLSDARLEEAPPGDDRIPGALETVFTGGIAWSPDAGAFAAVRARYFGDYPLVEDNSVRADAAALLNADLGYRFGAGPELRFTMLNLLDAEAADIQYFYPSRLPGEPAAGVEDVHFHPVEPRQLRASLHWQF
ncbi:MAG: TonB-dependent receptor [Gemmatimonadota bacterium]